LEIAGIWFVTGIAFWLLVEIVIVMHKIQKQQKAEKEDELL
jgi:hypothetical protein